MMAYSFAQTGPQGNSKQDRYHNYKMLKLTEELELTEEQTAELFPLFREHREEIEQLHKEKKELLNKIDQILKDPNPDYDEGKKLCREIEDNYDINQEKRKNFYLDVEEILTDEQYLKFYLFESRFHKRVKKMIKNFEKEKIRTH